MGKLTVNRHFASFSGTNDQRVFGRLYRPGEGWLGVEGQSAGAAVPSAFRALRVGSTALSSGAMVVIVIILH